MKLFRLILVLTMLAAVVAGFVWLALQPWTVTIRAGQEIELKAAAAVALLIAIVWALMFVLWLIGFLWTLPSRIGKSRAESQKKKGIEALGLSIAANEAGETDEARKAAQKAIGHIGESPAARLLAATFAVRSGDFDGAEPIYAGLVDEAGFTIAAHRGLAEVLLARGDNAGAIEQAQTAYGAAPKARWPGRFILTQHIESGRWEDALSFLDQMEKSGSVDKNAAKRYRGALLAAQSHRLEQNAQRVDALDMAISAVKTAPNFVPAVVMASRLSVIAGRDWQAAAKIEAAWEVSPHPALALAYADLKPGLSRAEKRKWLAGLAARNKDHRESLMLLAQGALEAREYAEAAELLDAVIKHRATSRAYSLRASVARHIGDIDASNHFLELAAAAPRDPDWSDLDPDGAAFDYRDHDWAEIILAYGENGALVHPRHDRGEVLRPARPLSEIASAPAKMAHQPDDPGIGPLELLGKDD